jgi:hypothetical protein
LFCPTKARIVNPAVDIGSTSHLFDSTEAYLLEIPMVCRWDCVCPLTRLRAEKLPCGPLLSFTRLYTRPVESKLTSG